VTAREDTATLREDAAAVREEAAGLREETSTLREEQEGAVTAREVTATVREGAAAVREEAAGLREEASTLRESTATLREDAASVREEAAQARQDLRHSRDLLDQTGRLAKVGGIQLDVATQTLYWTEEVYRIHEVDPAIKPTVAAMIQFYAPEARPVIAAAVQAAIDLGTPFDLELPLMTARGRHIWVHALGTAERRDGKTIRVYGACQDITARKQAEVELESLARFPSENPDPILRIARDGTLLYINPVGLSLLPQWHLEVGHASPPRLREAAFNSLDNGSTHVLDLEHGERVYSFFVAPIIAGRYANCYGRDITARKQAEVHLRAMAEMLDTAPSSITVTDEQGRFLFANRKTYEIHGYDEREFMALNLRDVLVSESAELIQKQMRIVAERGEATFEVVHVRKDRTTLTLDVFVKQVEWAGALAVLSIATDITIQKRAEEALRASEYRLRRLFETAPDGILILDADTGQVIDANPFMQDLLGYSVDEFLGKKLWEVGPFKAVVASKTTFAELRLKDRLHYEALPLETKDGRRIEVEFVSNAYQVNEKRLIQCNIRDITERVQLEAQFRQAQKMESVGQLASGIAHDFNNLLTVINGMSELLLAQVNQDDPMRADVQEISRAGERAATLTRQLLAFSRQQILESRVLDCNMIVSGMESLLGRLLGEDIELVVKLTQGVGRVKADPGQIEQVLSNLAVNARDAMPQGGQLTIETENVTTDQDYARQHGVAVPPGSYALLTVSDSGVGMDEATRARIFEPFFTTKGPGKGTGLGLSTVYGVVKQSLGFIWVYSEVGRGTSFKILLPQVTEAAAPDWPELTVVPTSGTETILLAEDNAGLRKLATRMLEPAGYTVLGAASGEEALRLLERHEEPVHLLLSDVVMPGMSGRQLAERIAETRPGMKVLYMSGYTSDTIVRHGVLEARVPFLNKPFTGAALLRKVREVLDS